jgi:mRNA-degrading endonuclease RelE of RelBE toxin-antitoxin system
VKVEVSEQVAAFVRRQPPEARRRLRLALRRLAAERGDVRALEGPLRGYHRLRVGAYRVVFAYGARSRGASALECIFAERRDVVYTVFEDALRERLLQALPGRE